MIFLRNAISIAALIVAQSVLFSGCSKAKQWSELKGFTLGTPFDSIAKNKDCVKGTNVSKKDYYICDNINADECVIL